MIALYLPPFVKIPNRLLEENNIQILERDTFYDLSNLQDVFLSNCNITNITGVFTNVTSIQQMYAVDYYSYYCCCLLLFIVVVVFVTSEKQRERNDKHVSLATMAHHLPPYFPSSLPPFARFTRVTSRILDNNFISEIVEDDFLNLSNLRFL